MTEDEINLIAAIKQGKCTSVEILITPNTLTKKAKVDLNTFEDERSYTALHIAVENNQRDVIDLILRLYPKLLEKKGKTSAKLALKKDNVQFFRKLLSVFILDIETLNGANGAIKKLLDYKPARCSENSSKYECVRDYAVDSTADVRLLTAMLDDRVDLNTFEDERGYTALHIALESNQQDVIDFILRLSPKLLEKKGEISAELALKKDNVQFFRKLLSVFTPVRETLNEANGTIKKLLDYKPAGRSKNSSKYECVRDYAVDSNADVRLLTAMLDDRVDLNTFEDEHGYTALHIALESNQQDVIDFILRLSPELLEKKGEISAELALKKDNVQFFRKLLSVLSLDIEILNKANGAIKKLLDYKPARRSKNLSKYKCIRDYAVDSNADVRLLTAMLEDEANTTDEESSGSEDDGFQPLSPKEATPNKKFLCRGVHFNPKFFTTKQRQLAIGKSYHQQPVYSQATKMLAEKIPKKADESFDYEHADVLVKGYFELLKLTPNRREHYSGTSPTRPNQVKPLKKGEESFSSLYIHFIQAYINSYDALFTGGEMTQNYNFYSNFNPIVSTIPTPDNAIKYALGEAVDQASRYVPKLRKSTGVLKHRRLGFLQAYAIDDDYYKQFAGDVKTLATDEKIYPAARRELTEVFFESSIPARYICGAQVFSLPSFNSDWSKKIEEIYGLDKKTYDNFRKSLKANPEKARDKILEIIKSVTASQLRIFKQGVESIQRSPPLEVSRRF